MGEESKKAGGKAATTREGSPAAQARTDKPLPDFGMMDEAIVDALMPKSDWKESGEPSGSLLQTAKSAMALAMKYDHADNTPENFKTAVNNCRRNLSQYSTRITLLETAAKARHQVQSSAIDARILAMDADIEQFKVREEETKAKLPGAREQRMRNRAYEVIATEIVKVESRPSLQNKINKVSSSTSKKRESTTNISNAVEKRVKSMQALAAQFDVLKEEVTTDQKK